MPGKKIKGQPGYTLINGRWHKTGVDNKEGSEKLRKNGFDGELSDSTNSTQGWVDVPQEKLDYIEEHREDYEEFADMMLGHYIDVDDWGRETDTLWGEGHIAFILDLPDAVSDSIVSQYNQIPESESAKYWREFDILYNIITKELKETSAALDEGKGAFDRFEKNFESEKKDADSEGGYYRFQLDAKSDGSPKVGLFHERLMSDYEIEQRYPYDDDDGYHGDPMDKVRGIS